MVFSPVLPFIPSEGSAGIIASEETLFQSGGFPHFESGEFPNFAQRLLNRVHKRSAPEKNNANTGQADEQKVLRPRFRDGDQGQRNPALSSCRLSIAVSPVLFSLALPFILSGGSTLVGAKIEHLYRAAVRLQSGVQQRARIRTLFAFNKFAQGRASNGARVRSILFYGTK